MEDREIVELYWQRDEAAITHTAEKYGAYCRSIIARILRAAGDAEECLNDTYLAAWNAMPPHRPAVLRTFLGRLSRNLSVNRALRESALKRGGGEVSVALEELRELCGGGSAEEAVELAELGRLLDAFLRALPEQERGLFLRRYYFLDSVEDAARRFGLRPGAARTRLHRTRKKLKDYLRKEGYAL